jgi:hypothetical protein
MFSARTLFGIASGAYAIWLCVLDIQQGHWFWLVLPVLLGAFAAWLIAAPQKITPAHARFRTYLDANPNAKKLDRLSKWLGWAAILLTIAWAYFALVTLHIWNIWWLLGVALALNAPSVVLSTIVVVRFTKDARANFEQNNAP